MRDSVADLDPEDPYVFGPPGSGSGSISQRYKFGFYYHCDFFMTFYFIFENYVNVP
jgi:hypothetical protein